jgi:hypothetical protein
LSNYPSKSFSLSNPRQKRIIFKQLIKGKPDLFLILLLRNLKLTFMKTKKFFFIAILFVGMTIASSVSCKKAIDDLINSCITTQACAGKSFKTCGSATGSGYYEYNGVKYNWTSGNVTSAATALATAMGCK